MHPAKSLREVLVQCWEKLRREYIGFRMLWYVKSPESGVEALVYIGLKTSRSEFVGFGVRFC